MILLSALIGPPIMELFSTEPNKDLIFNAYSIPFANSESWVKAAFTAFFNNCWSPRWYTDGRQIQSIEAIVQTQSPDTVVSDTNNTAGAYAWDIRFNTTGGSDPMSPNPCHQRFYYRPSDTWHYSDRAADDCSDRTDMLMGYDNSGPESVGVSTGTFTNFASGTVPEATWELQNTSKCMDSDCQAFRIYQKVGETKPYKIVAFDCATGVVAGAEYFTTRNEADSKGSEWVMSQHTNGNHNTTGCTDQNLDATGDNGSEPCDDSNASVLADGSCGPCNTGYILENDICTESDDDDDDEDATGKLKYILWIGGALLGLLVLKKIAA
jgi:hypothetical protein